MLRSIWIRGPAAVVGLAAFLAMSPDHADAALSDCSATVADAVKITSDCGVGSSFKDDATTVNGDEAFEISDWEFAGKQDIGGAFDSGIDIGLVITWEPDMLSGTWAIDDVWATFESIMLTFVDGGGPDIDPQGYVAYLIAEGETSGTWDSMFTGKNDELREISHVSAWVSGDGNGDPGPDPGPDPVPEPGVLGLMGLGLLGLGLTAYTRRRRVA